MGATVVWSPSQKAVIAGASALRATGSVEYVRPEIGEVEQPGSNAAYFAAVDPQVVAALVVVAEEAERIADLGVHTRLKRALAALTAVAAPRTGGAR